MEKTPGLFGQIHSNRDYRKQETWGKNQFNSSFPASLVAYMQAKQIEPVYLTLNKNCDIKHINITGEDLYGMNPLSDNLFYEFEQTYQPFAKFYTGKSERIDLVLSKNDDNMPLRGLEVKLTALPDNTTKNLPEEEYSCEIVVRPPTICFVACSICSHYSTSAKKERLRKLLGGVSYITHWEMIEEVAPHYEEIKKVVLRVMKDLVAHQTPIMIQPVWKTTDKNFDWLRIVWMYSCGQILPP